LCWGPSPGIYIASNRSGAWVTSKVADTCAPGSVSLSVDGSQVSVAYDDGTNGLIVQTNAATSIASVGQPNRGAQPGAAGAGLGSRAGQPGTGAAGGSTGHGGSHTP
jgi:hypothetical protein